MEFMLCDPDGWYRHGSGCAEKQCVSVAEEF